MSLIDSNSIKRMWINAPARGQDMHDRHGENVLVAPEPHSQNFVRVYFLSGPVVCQVASKLSLSEGWRQ